MNIDLVTLSNSIIDASDIDSIYNTSLHITVGNYKCKEVLDSSDNRTAKEIIDGMVNYNYKQNEFYVEPVKNLHEKRNRIIITRNHILKEDIEIYNPFNGKKIECNKGSNLIKELQRSIIAYTNRNNSPREKYIIDIITLTIIKSVVKPRSDFIYSWKKCKEAYNSAFQLAWDKNKYKDKMAYSFLTFEDYCDYREIAESIRAVILRMVSDLSDELLLRLIKMMELRVALYTLQHVTHKYTNIPKSRYKSKKLLSGFLKVDLEKKYDMHGKQNIQSAMLKYNIYEDTHYNILNLGDVMNIYIYILSKDT